MITHEHRDADLLPPAIRNISRSIFPSLCCFGCRRFGGSPAYRQRTSPLWTCRASWWESRRRATARPMIPLANRLTKIFLLSAVDFEMLVFVLVLVSLIDRKSRDFNWLHANIHYLGRNGMDEIRMVGFPS
jgi:hypothetical protein